MGGNQNEYVIETMFTFNIESITCTSLPFVKDLYTL